VIPAGIAAGDLGRARSSVAPRRGTSCHVGPGGQAVRVRGRRRGVRADARALAGRPAGRDWAERGSGWAEREAERAQLGFSAGASARVGPGWGEAGPSELGRGELGRAERVLGFLGAGLSIFLSYFLFFSFLNLIQTKFEFKF